MSFAATLYLARMLGAAGYGVVALAGAVLLYFAYLADYGIDTIGVAHLRREAGGASAGPLIGALVLGRLAVATGLFVLLAAAGLTILPQPEGAIIAATAAMLFYRAANTRWAFLAMDRPGAVAVSRASGEVLTALLVVTTVRGIGDLGHVPVTQVAGDALAALILAVLLRRAGERAPVAWRRDLAGPVFRAARPLVAHSLLALLVFNCDLILLRFFRDTTTVGFYAAAYTLVAFLSNLAVTFGYSLLPHFAARDHDDAARVELYQSSLVQAAAATLPLAAGGTLVAGGLIAFVFGARFAASALPLAILLWSVPMVWLRTTVQMAFVARNRQADVLKITIVGAALTVVLDLAVIPRWGMAGAAAVTVFTELVRAVIALAWAARTGLPLPSVLRVLRPVAATLLMAIVVRLLAPSVPVLVAVGAGAAVYIVALLLAGAVRLGRGSIAIRL